MRYVKRLVLFVSLINLFVLLISLQSLQTSYAQYVQTAYTAASNLSTVLERDLDSEFNAVDDVLLAVADAHDHRLAAKHTHYGELNRLIKRHLSRNTTLMAIRITDAHGESVAGFEGDKPPAGSGIGERDYFIRHRSNADAGLLISEPLVGKITGSWGIVFSRRLNHPDGSFAGVVLAHMGLDHIAADFSTLRLGPGGTITLRDSQLKRVVRVPPLDAAHATKPDQVPAEFRNAFLANPKAGTYASGDASIDGIARVHAYRQIAQHPYYVNVGMARDDYLLAWYSDFKIRIGLFIAFILLTYLGTWYFLRSWRQRQLILVRMREVEARTHASEERFRLAMQASADGLWDWDIASDDGYFSPAYYRMLGCEPLAFPMNGQAWRELLHPEDRHRVLQANQDCIQNRTQHFEVEFRMRAKDGSWVWILGRGAAASRGADGHALRMIGTHQNITGRKFAEQAVQAAQVEAERANNAKSRFLAAASHDLRQPLAALSLYLEVLKIKMAPADDKLLANMDNCVVSLSALLSDLLDISKLEAEVVVPEISNFPVSELLSRLVAVHLPPAQHKGLRLRYRPTTLQAHTDPVLLARMLGNLISNAIHYTEHGGVLIACRCHRGKTWIEVWDSGIGIAANQTEVIFEEYRQLEPNHPRRGGGSVGSGLGLAIVAKTAALLGLEVRVQSRLGRGSLFALELPLA